MTVLVIRRAHSKWTDRARSYKVLVDGQQRAQIGDDAVVQVPVTPGRHVVRLEIDWCRSPDLACDLAHGEILRLECGPNASPLLALLYITIWRKNYIRLEMAS
jgi:hypothetical protein